MIREMVEGLAARLAQSGGSAEEWARLIRAYSVLQDLDKAKAALADARKSSRATRRRSGASMVLRASSGFREPMG